MRACRKTAEEDRKKFERELREQHEKEVERLKDGWQRKELERQLELEKERAKKDADAQEAKLKAQERISELENARKAAESKVRPRATSHCH